MLFLINQKKNSKWDSFSIPHIYYYYFLLSFVWFFFFDLCWEVSHPKIPLLKCSLKLKINLSLFSSHPPFVSLYFIDENFRLLTETAYFFHPQSLSLFFRVLSLFVCFTTILISNFTDHFFITIISYVH